MPARPRIWPSIRFSLFRQEVLISVRIGFIYPPRVYCSSRPGEVWWRSTIRHKVGRMPAIITAQPCRPSPAAAPNTAAARRPRSRSGLEPEPKKFLQAREPAPAAPAGAIYTCPMHPEVRQAGPGSCPICGMALEPEQVSLDDRPDPELIDMMRRFWMALVLTVPVFVLEMGGHLGLMHLPRRW